MTKKDLEKQIELLVKDDEKSQQTIIKQSQEIEILNNIIEKLEKYSKDRYYEEKKLNHYARLNAYKDIWNKIKELKGSDKE